MSRQDNGRGWREANPPGAEEEAGRGEEPRDAAPVPAIAEVHVPVADPRRRSAAAAATGPHAARFPRARLVRAGSGKSSLAEPNRASRITRGIWFGWIKGGAERGWAGFDDGRARS
jgi:hypothetical protein